MGELHDVIIKPLTTEKSWNAREKHNIYTFMVKIEANKCQIKQAVEAAFNVKVASVTTERVVGKSRRVRMVPGRRADWKKARVRLAPGSVIEVL